MAEHFDVAIVGSGFSGIGTAIRLKRAGFDDFAVFERADDLWPSYSWSFRQRTRRFEPSEYELAA